MTQTISIRLLSGEQTEERPMRTSKEIIIFFLNLRVCFCWFYLFEGGGSFFFFFSFNNISFSTGEGGWWFQVTTQVIPAALFFFSPPFVIYPFWQQMSSWILFVTSHTFFFKENLLLFPFIYFFSKLFGTRKGNICSWWCKWSCLWREAAQLFWGHQAKKKNAYSNIHHRPRFFEHFNSITSTFVCWCNAVRKWAHKWRAES